MTQKLVFLMYHELERPGTPLCRTEPGYVRYVVSAADFEHQMRWLKTAGFHATNVTEALSFPAPPAVALTFDDGCASDLLVAAPVLHELSFSATFYITVAWLGSPGFLSTSQLRELCDSGLEIGSHSMTHPWLADLNDERLEREMRDSKHQLEDVTGRPVLHFSCPGGRFDRRVQSAAHRLGYNTMTTSFPRANSRSTNPYDLGRIVVMRNYSLNSFQNICRNRSVWRLQALETVRGTAKRLLGNSSYDHLRAVLLGRQPDHEQTSD